MDYRAPIKARAEEVDWIDQADVEQPEHAQRAILWHLSEPDSARVVSLQACWNCLTGFPGRLGSQDLSVWKQADFRFLGSYKDAERLIKQHRCPICKCECTPEMMALQDAGTMPQRVGDE